MSRVNKSLIAICEVRSHVDIGTPRLAWLLYSYHHVQSRARSLQDTYYFDAALIVDCVRCVVRGCRLLVRR